MHPIIQSSLALEEVSFSYSDRQIFNHLSFRFGTGVSLIRCDESRGKSTMIQLLSGDLVPDQGEIFLNGLSSKKNQTAYRSQVYFFDTRCEMFDQISAIQYFSDLQNTYPEFDQTKVPDLVAGLGLTPHQDKPLYMLSAGSKRKVWIAAAIASNAKITLIDDITAALDRGSIDFIIRQLIALGSENNRHTIISHYDTLDQVPFSSILDL